MGKISLELFDKCCEIISFEYKKDYVLVFRFDRELDGYVHLGNHATRLKGRSCAVDIRDLAEGEHIPRLILEDMTIDLPRITNKNGIIAPKEHQTEEIGDVSLRERRLCRRVDELEARLDEITKKVFGSKIF